MSGASPGQNVMMTPAANNSMSMEMGEGVDYAGTLMYGELQSEVNRLRFQNN